jgi:hypothetical protein
MEAGAHAVLALLSGDFGASGLEKEADEVKKHHKVRWWCSITRC